MNAERLSTLPLQPREWSEGFAESEVAGDGDPDSATTSIAAPVLVGVSARLHQRHPSASPAMVQNSIDDAIRRFDQARVRQFLSILVERSASDSLRHATHLSDPFDTPNGASI